MRAGEARAADPSLGGPEIICPVKLNPVPPRAPPRAPQRAAPRDPPGWGAFRNRALIALLLALAAGWLTGEGGGRVRVGRVTKVKAGKSVRRGWGVGGGLPHTRAHTRTHAHTHAQEAGRKPGIQTHPPAGPGRDALGACARLVTWARCRPTSGGPRRRRRHLPSSHRWWENPPQCLPSSWRVVLALLLLLQQAGTRAESPHRYGLAACPP